MGRLEGRTAAWRRVGKETEVFCSVRKGLGDGQGSIAWLEITAFPLDDPLVFNIPGYVCDGACTVMLFHTCWSLWFFQESFCPLCSKFKCPDDGLGFLVTYFSPSRQLLPTGVKAAAQNQTTPEGTPWVELNSFSAALWVAATLFARLCSLGTSPCAPIVIPSRNGWRELFGMPWAYCGNGQRMSIWTFCFHISNPCPWQHRISMGWNSI